MPQPFNNAVMTNAGARLLTRAQAGEIKIEFTRLATGNGVYGEDEKNLDFLQEQTSLKSIKNSFALSNIEIYSEHSVRITTLITNQNPKTGEPLIDEGYYINEMGLFAKEKGGGDDTEVLYSIVVTSGENGDFMPPYNGYNPAQITQDYYVTVANSANVTIKVTGTSSAVKTRTLAAGQTSITFDLEGVQENSSFKLFAENIQLDYNGIDIDTENSQMTIFFEAQKEDVTIKLVLYDSVI